MVCNPTLEETFWNFFFCCFVFVFRLFSGVGQSCHLLYTCIILVQLALTSLGMTKFKNMTWSMSLVLLILQDDTLSQSAWCSWDLHGQWKTFVPHLKRLPPSATVFTIPGYNQRRFLSFYLTWGPLFIFIFLFLLFIYFYFFNFKSFTFFS